MPVTITFHRFGEKQPEHNQDIIWLEDTTSFGYSGFKPRHVSAEYYWQGVYLDSKGQLVPTGHDVGYSPDLGEPEPDEPSMSYKLSIMTNTGHPFTNEDLWVSEDEYWEAFS